MSADVEGEITIYEEVNSIFYLEINANEPANMRCFWHWVDIVEALGADFYVVCDKADINAE